MRIGNKFIRILIVLGLLITGVLPIKSNNIIQQQYQFKYLSIDDGLSHGKVQTIVQDQYGYIWLGTGKGINRFDGYTTKKFTQYLYNDTLFDISVVNEMVLDKKNKLWAATSDGLLYFDIHIETFVKYTDKKVNIDEQGSTISLKIDHENKLWLAASGALFKIDTDKEEGEEFILKNENKETLSEILECFIQSNGNIWIGFSNEGCGIFNQKEESFKHFVTDASDPYSLGDKRVHCFYEDGSGNIWLGQNDNGVSIYNPQTGSFNTYFPDSINPTSGRVKAISKDSQGNLWLGTMAGLYKVDTTNLSFNRYAYSDHLYSTLSHSSIQCLFIDNQQTLWIGTYSGGASYTNLVRNGFFHYKSSLIPNKYFLSQKDVTSLATDQNGFLWVGTESGGLNSFDLSTGEYTYYKEDKGNENALQSNNIKSIEVTADNNLWIGTYNGGLSYFDVASKTFTNYNTNSTDIMGLSSNRIYSTLTDSEGNLWVGTSKMLNMLPYGSDTFISFNKETQGYFGSDVFPYIVSIIQDSRGWIWFSGHQSIYIFKPEENTFYDLVAMGLFSKQYFEHIVEDQNGDMWFDEGLGKIVRYVSKDDIYKVFGQDENIPQVQFSSLATDNNGNLWVSSQEGLFRFNSILKSQDSITFNLYGKDDGLQSKFFYPGSIDKSESGEVFIGGINGFNSFHPQEVMPNPIPPSVVITKLKINNSDVKIGEKVGNRRVLKQCLLVTESLMFHSKVKVFSIEFAGLHFVSPDQNRYKYILEGYDDDWVTTTADKRVASYSNLPAGKYTFKVMAANNDGVWNESPVELLLRVRPPFYKSKVFIILLIIVIILGVYFGVKIRESQLKSDKEKLEASLVEGKAQLEHQKEEIIKQKEEIKLRDEEEKEIRWHNRGLAKFSDLISKNKDSYSSLCQSVITNLVDYVNAGQGAIFLLNDNDPDNPQLDYTAGYAYANENEESKTIYPGEGYVGTCFLDKRTIRLDDLPENYLKIKSGLGELSPNYVVLIPMRFDELVTGVIEIGSFNKLEEYQIEFIEKVAESTTSIITILKSEQQAKDAVEYANQNAEEIKAADEELRQNLEEVTAIQEELNRNQEELLAEQAMFQTLMDFLQDRITFKDSESIYLRINKIKSDSLNLKSSSDAIGKSDKHFFGEEHFKKAYEVEKEIFNKGIPIINKEELLRFEDGTVKWGATSRVPFKSEDGKTAGTLIITKDITKEKTLESESIAFRELLNVVAQQYPIMLYNLDKDFKISNISGNGLQKFGLKENAFNGKTFKKVFGVSLDKLIENKELISINTELKTDNGIVSIEHQLIFNKSSEGYNCCGVFS